MNHLHWLWVWLGEVTRRKVIVAEHVQDQVGTFLVILFAKILHSFNLMFVLLLSLDSGVGVDVVVANGAIQPTDPT